VLLRQGKKLLDMNRRIRLQCSGLGRRGLVTRLAVTSRRRCSRTSILFERRSDTNAGCLQTMQPLSASTHSMPQALQYVCPHCIVTGSLQTASLQAEAKAAGRLIERACTRCMWA